MTDRILNSFDSSRGGCRIFRDGVRLEETTAEGKMEASSHKLILLQSID